MHRMNEFSWNPCHLLYGSRPQRTWFYAVSLHLGYVSCPAPTAKSQKEIAHLPLLFLEKETRKFICFSLFLRWGLHDS